MQTHADDETFEAYLKQFRPRAPEALRVVTTVRRTRRTVALSAWAAMILVTVALTATNWIARRSPRTRTLHPLTIAAANELLERAPSVKAAMDELMLDSGERTVPKGQSAFAVLGEENLNP